MTQSVSVKSRLRKACLAGLATGAARVAVWLYRSWDTTGHQFWIPAATLIGLIAGAVWLIRGMFSEAGETTAPRPRSGIAVVMLAGISIFLFGVVAMLLRQEYRSLTDPRVAGHVERTWIAVRGNHDTHVRVADIDFTVTRAGQPIRCEARGLLIGDATSGAKAGDRIELSSAPESCERPRAIGAQDMNWLMGALSAIVVATGMFFALLAWAAGHPESGFGAWPRDSFSI